MELEELVVVAALWHALGRESLNALADALIPVYTLLVVALISVVANREHQDRIAAAENASRGVAKAPPERAPLAATPINAQPEVTAWLVEDGDFSAASTSGDRPNLTGTWKLTRNENLHPFLTELGVRLIARQLMDKAKTTHEIVHEHNTFRMSVKTLKSYTVGPCEIGGGAVSSEALGVHFEDTMSWDGDRLRLRRVSREKGYVIVGHLSLRPGRNGQPSEHIFEREVQGLDGSKRGTAAIQYFERVS